MISSKALYNFYYEEGKINQSIINDLFGYMNWTDDMMENEEETLSMFIGLYEGLFLLDVSYKEIYRCFLSNKLDELIHTKYSLNKSKYYKNFCDKKIIIGKTFLNLNEKREELNHENIPEIYTQILPPYHYNVSYNTSTNTICQKSIGKLEENIAKKIEEYKSQDKRRKMEITDDYVCINDVKELLNKQDGKCYVCCDNVITREWVQKCYYQFTLDRIDNKLPHNRNNVLICCYYCNSRIYCESIGHKKDSKICQYGCHIIDRKVSRKRYDVLGWETLKLKLK